MTIQSGIPELGTTIQIDFGWILCLNVIYIMYVHGNKSRIITSTEYDLKLKQIQDGSKTNINT